MTTKYLRGPGFRKYLNINTLHNRKKLHFFLVFIGKEHYFISMKHSESGIKKVLKQMKKCPEVIRIERRSVGHAFYAKGVEKPLTIHWSAKAFHEIRRWCRKHTSIQQLKY